MLDGGLAHHDRGVEQAGVAVVADEALGAQGTDARAVGRDEDERLVVGGAREAIRDLEHRGGRRRAGHSTAALGDVPRRDQGDLAVRLARQRGDQVAQMDVVALERAVEALLGHGRAINRRELAPHLVGHPVVRRRAGRRVGGGLCPPLGERRGARGIEGIGGHSPRDRRGRALQREHRDHGHHRDREQRVSVEAQVDHQPGTGRLLTFRHGARTGADPARGR